MHYRVRACDKDSTVVASGVFRSGRPAVDVSAIPSGMYDMQLYFAREKSDTAALRLIVSHETDTLPPFETPFSSRSSCRRCNALRTDRLRSAMEIRATIIFTTL